MSNYVDKSILIEEPYRSSLMDRLCAPDKCCPEYRKCSNYGRERGLYCELGDKAAEEFHSELLKVINLSDLPGWYSLRTAIRSLDGVQALKTCELIAARVTVITQIAREEELHKARSFKTLLMSGLEWIEEAQGVGRHLDKSVQSAEKRIPSMLATKDFVDQGEALVVLLQHVLLAFHELYRGANDVLHPDVLSSVHRAAFRRNIDELQHPSSKRSGDRYWGEWQDVLDGLEEITRRSDKSSWIKHSPKRTEMEPGDALRQKARRKSAEEDEQILKTWLDKIGPGVWEKIQSSPDQVEALTEIMKKVPVILPVQSVVLQIALLHKDDLLALNAFKSKTEGPKGE